MPARKNETLPRIHEWCDREEEHEWLLRSTHEMYVRALQRPLEKPEVEQMRDLHGRSFVRLFAAPRHLMVSYGGHADHQHAATVLAALPADLRVWMRPVVEHYPQMAAENLRKAEQALRGRYDDHRGADLYISGALNMALEALAYAVLVGRVPLEDALQLRQPPEAEPTPAPAPMRAHAPA